MQPLLAIAWLTWKAAFRFRLFLVVAVLLLGSVVGLPLLIKDDGTARGFTQILLTYTLGTITALLGLSTLWLACGTLARDIEDCTVQVVAIKPIARWQIWLGKWLGIMSLNAALLALSGASVYGLLQWRATRLPADQQKILRTEVLVARGSVKAPSFDREIQAETDRLLRERLQKNPDLRANIAEARKQILEQVKAEYQIVPPGYVHEWEIDLGTARHFARGQPLFLRVKFNAADRSTSGTFDGRWRVGVPRKTQLWHSEVMSLAPDTFHEFEVPANYDEKGMLTVAFLQREQHRAAVPAGGRAGGALSPGQLRAEFRARAGDHFLLDGIAGHARARLGQFPFFPGGGVLVVGRPDPGALQRDDLQRRIGGTLMGYNSETGRPGHSALDIVAIPVFRAVLEVINLAKDFSPIDSLSTGRSVTWGELGRAFGQIVLLLGGSIGLIGILIFNRRELATAQAQ